MKKNLILIIVSLAMFMETLDTTIINTAIPVMAHSLAVNPIDLKLALISYLLSLAVFIPISGWIADKWGIKTVFIAALSIFTMSSIWCGFTSSLNELIGARIVQGIGGSLTMPIGRLIILRISERHELISKMSIVVMTASSGMLLGPLLGGLITHHMSWRWIFWVNAPAGVIAILLTTYLLPLMPPKPVLPLDKIGFLLFGSGLSTLTLGLSLMSESDESFSSSVLIIALALILLLAYFYNAQNKTNPIIKIRLLEIRTFSISVFSNLLSRISFGGMPFLLPLLIQICLGYSSQLAGALLAPIAAGVFLVKPLSIHILRVLGYKKLLLINTFLVSLILWSFCFINLSTNALYIGLLSFIYGFFIALQYTGMNSLAYANINEIDMSSATSIMSTIQQVAQSFGVAIAAILISLLSQQHQLTVPVFHKTFFMLGLLTLLSGSIFIFLKQEDGQELIKPNNKL